MDEVRAGMDFFQSHAGQYAEGFGGMGLFQSYARNMGFFGLKFDGINAAF
jgi:hypothetical protein